ncbi:hypothetical protein [Kutzneria sp. NPDC051319]|uniref:hypothetical protein n=1 Tax=Kutzneria sp. NPDC051319 TaxID=3155047 RepID=UPI00341A38CB
MDDIDETCGDCIDGRCHFGDGPAPGERCGCDRHAASVRAREHHDDGHQAG